MARKRLVGPWKFGKRVALEGTAAGAAQASAAGPTIGRRLAGSAVGSGVAGGSITGGMPTWSAAPIYYIVEGQVYSNLSVPVSAGGASITLAWVSPGSKPAWVTLSPPSATPTISFSGAQVDANDVVSMVLSATISGQSPVNSPAGGITVSVPQVGENPASGTVLWDEGWDLFISSASNLLDKSNTRQVAWTNSPLAIYPLKYDAANVENPAIRDGWSYTRERALNPVMPEGTQLHYNNNVAPIWGGFGQVVWDEEFGEFAIVMPG